MSLGLVPGISAHRATEKARWKMHPIGIIKRKVSIEGAGLEVGRLTLESLSHKVPK